MRTVMQGSATVCAAFLFACAAHAAEPDFVPSADLLAAARKEGKLVLYTANFLDTEQAVSKRFSARFGIQLEIVRAPTGSLITRIKTEAAANRLIADVIDISDRVQARAMIELFAPYAPPNAADYPEVARTGDRLWPRSGNAWTITYNSALVTDPPKSWADLAKPEFGKQRLGQTVVSAGGGPFNRAMFERKVLGEDYWTKQAALKPALFPSQAQMVDAMIRGEIAIAPLVTNLAIPLAAQGAPLKWFFAPEGVPVTVFCAGLAKGAAQSQCREAVHGLGDVARGPGADGRARLVFLAGAGPDAAGRRRRARSRPGIRTTPRSRRSSSLGPTTGTRPTIIANKKREDAVAHRHARHDSADHHHGLLSAAAVVRPQPRRPRVQVRARRQPVPRTVSRRGRQHHRRAGSRRARHRDRRRQPLRSDRGRQVVVLLSDRTPRRRARPPRHLARLDVAPRPAARAKSCGRCRRPISPAWCARSSRAGRSNTPRCGRWRSA